jgi:hypothetical protein
MTKLLGPASLALALLVLPVLKASAQDKKEQAPLTKSPLPANWAKLGLNDDQKAKITAVQSKFKAKIDELSKQLKDLRKEEMSAMMEVLTDAQKARLKELALEKAGGGTGNKPEDKPTEKKP